MLFKRNAFLIRLKFKMFIFKLKRNVLNRTMELMSITVVLWYDCDFWACGAGFDLLAGAPKKLMTSSSFRGRFEMWCFCNIVHTHSLFNNRGSGSVWHWLSLATSVDPNSLWLRFEPGFALRIMRLRFRAKICSLLRIKIHPNPK